MRSFLDSDADGVGDLKGLTSKLEYIKDVGANAIWLLPVFESPVFHGYLSSDFYSIRKEYGGMPEFQNFLKRAHDLGIRVILDLVVHYTSDQHPWFVESATNPSGPKRDWYSWRKDDPNWGQPWNHGQHTWHPYQPDRWYYGLFEKAAPGLNLMNPETRAEIFKVAEFWLDQGVDGFRLDSIPYVIPGANEPHQNSAETHAFWKEFAHVIRAKKPGAFLVGEVWQDAGVISTYYKDKLSSLFNFPLRDALIQGVNEGAAQSIIQALSEMKKLYPAGAERMDSTFLANHDMERAISQLKLDKQKLKLAYAIQASLPGVPFLFYGDEIGLDRGWAPMHWTPTGGFSTHEPWCPYASKLATDNVELESADPASVLSFYKKMNRVRLASNALKRGELKVLNPKPLSPALLIFTRRSGSEKVLAVFNLSAQSLRTTLPVGWTQNSENLISIGDLSFPSASEVELGALAGGVWKSAN